MSFAIPRNVPDFGSDARQYEDALWNSSKRSRFGAGDNNAAGVSIGSFPFRGSSKELPMYKDKPYNYPFSRRRRSKRLIAGLIIVGLVLWWYIWIWPGSVQRTKDSSKSTRGSLGLLKGKGQKFWTKRREDVVTAMEKSWAGYEKYAWGFDEFHPDTKTGRYMVPPTGLGWIIVDALDTLMLMNMTTQLRHARDWMSTTLTYNLDHDVNTFETTIRMLGGFLSAHYLQITFPQLCPVDMGRGGEDLYLEKATDLAERVMSAFESTSGVPYASVNLGQRKGLGSHSDGGSSSLAEATTVQLEFKYLANLTGERDYWTKVEKVMEVVDVGSEETDGLKSIFLSPETGTFTSNNFRLGSRGDSYYEYLIKQYLQTNEPIYRDMWNESLDGMKKHLITYSSPSNFTFIAERPYGLNANLDPKMDHLVCFMPGTLALSTTGGISVAEAKKLKQWNSQKQEDLNLAIELMRTCWGMYKVTKTGLAAEITHFGLASHPIMYSDAAHRPSPPPVDVFERHTDDHAAWRKDFIIKPADTHNLQRPETVESLFYMWRITGDETYRQWGSEMFESFMKYTEAADGAGYTSINDVNQIPPPSRNNMESFWPAETLKYFFLLFSPNDLLPLDKVVFNTEAHPFPRFEIGKVLTTGWKRGTRKSVAKTEDVKVDNIEDSADARERQKIMHGNPTIETKPVSK